jgi:hypothetical protein
LRLSLGWSIITASVCFVWGGCGMPITGKTGADAFYLALKRQIIVMSHYGPKFLTLVNTMHGLGLLDETEYLALVAAFNALNTLAAAAKKVADYSGF